MNDETLKYYDQNADAFVQGTISVNFSDIQERFQCALHGNSVLDFGCGSGRDTKKFEDLNLRSILYIQGRLRISSVQQCIVFLAINVTKKLDHNIP